jgi:hypothetical protein
MPHTFRLHARPGSAGRLPAAAISVQNVQYLRAIQLHMSSAAGMAAFPGILAVGKFFQPQRSPKNKRAAKIPSLPRTVLCAAYTGETQ